MCFSCLFCLISVLSVITHHLWVIIREFVFFLQKWGVCGWDTSTKMCWHLMVSHHLYLYFILPPIFSPHTLYDTYSCFEHVYCYLLSITIPENPFLFCTHIVPLSSFSRILFYLLLHFSCTIYSFPLPLAHGLSSSSFLWFFHCFLLPHRFSSLFFRISTSDEQQGEDCSASLCSHFMVWLKGKGESEVERQQLRQTSGGSNARENWNKEKQMIISKKIHHETATVQRGCLFTIVCAGAW